MQYLAMKRGCLGKYITHYDFFWFGARQYVFLQNTVVSTVIFC